MIEQLRVRRRFAGRAEIVHGANEADAEQVMPNSIRQHAGCEWVVVIGDPFLPAPIGAHLHQYPVSVRRLR